jgi:hypothetical protein
MRRVRIVCRSCGVLIADATLREEDAEGLGARVFLCRDCTAPMLPAGPPAVRRSRHLALLIVNSLDLADRLPDEHAETWRRHAMEYAERLVAMLGTSWGAGE